MAAKVLEHEWVQDALACPGAAAYPLGAGLRAVRADQPPALVDRLDHPEHPRGRLLDQDLEAAVE